MFGRGRGLIKAGLTFLTLSQIPLLILGLILMLGINFQVADIDSLINFSITGAVSFGLVIASIVVISIASSRNEKYAKGKAGVFAPFSMVFLALLVTRASRMYDIIIRNEGTFSSLFKSKLFLYLFITAVISLFFFVTLFIAKLKVRYALIKILYFLSYFAILFILFMQVSYTIFTIKVHFYPEDTFIVNLPYMISAGFEFLALLFFFFASLVLGYSSGLKQIDEFGEKVREYQEAHPELKEESKVEEKAVEKVEEKPVKSDQKEPEELDLSDIVAEYECAQDSGEDMLGGSSAEPTKQASGKFTCPNCCASFDAKPDECPYCGTKFK